MVRQTGFFKNILDLDVNDHTTVSQTGSVVWSSDGKYRYSKVSISIDTAGPVIDKYRYFPFFGFDRKMLPFFQENLLIFLRKFYVFHRKTHDFSI